MSELPNWNWIVIATFTDPERMKEGYPRVSLKSATALAKRLKEKKHIDKVYLGRITQLVEIGR